MEHGRVLALWVVAFVLVALLGGCGTMMTTRANAPDSDVSAGVSGETTTPYETQSP
jgi:uncharacterized protein YceK